MLCIFGWWWVVVCIFWVVMGGDGYFLSVGGWLWIVVGGGPVYNSPLSYPSCLFLSQQRIL